MKCPRCLNEDKSYFYKGSKGWMCRKCISFKRVLIEEELEPIQLNEFKEDIEEYTLKYPLTPYQKRISDKTKQLIDHTDVLISAICGAGKTELVIDTIALYLRRRQRVCFAISRRQVVLELAKRLQGIFRYAKVIPVCEGYTNDLVGDVIVCTTHQCYRYPHTFDLLILDECDAFPYKGNTVLENIVKTACKGHMIYLTATKDDSLRQKIKNKEVVELCLYQRPHQRDLVVPRNIILPNIMNLFVLIHYLNTHINRSILIFVPTIEIGTYLHLILRCMFKCDFLNSKSKDLDNRIQAFRDMKINILISTTILERGITLKGIDVIVYNANHEVFDLASLIQMSGRVGRAFEDLGGDCLFLSNAKSEIVDECIRECQNANTKKMLMV